MHQGMVFKNRGYTTACSFMMVAVLAWCSRTKKERSRETIDYVPILNAIQSGARVTGIGEYLDDPALIRGHNT